MRTLLQVYLMAITIFLSPSIIAQESGHTEPSKKTEDVYLSRAGLNRLLNLKFGSIVTGQSSSTAIGNYASFDPANGSFVFKGSFGIGDRLRNSKDSVNNTQPRNPDSANISYLTFRLEGDLISDSYAALFTNSKLNTHAALEMQYHLRLSKSGIHYFLHDSKALHLSKMLDSIKYYQDLHLLFSAANVREELRHQHQINFQLIAYELQENQHKLDSVYNRQRAAVSAADFLSVKKEIAVVDSITQLVRKKQLDTMKLNKDIDSLTYIINNSFYLRQVEKEKLNSEYDKKITLLEGTAHYSSLNIWWITFIAGISKKNFYTYDTSLVFSKQVAKQELGTFRLGFAFNYYREYSETNRAWFANLGVIRYKDNNTSLLSTQEITQESVTKNSVGDTTRKISRKYNVYTDIIVESQVWSVFGNWYFIQRGKQRAFHVYPSMDIYDHGENLMNLGLGYIVSFKNSKKDQPIINAEGYVQLQDIFNHLNSKQRLWNRNEIGVRFTLPFSFF